MDKEYICVHCKNTAHCVSTWIAQKNGESIGLICTSCANDFRKEFESDVKTLTINLDNFLTMKKKKENRKKYGWDIFFKPKVVGGKS